MNAKDEPVRSAGRAAESASLGISPSSIFVTDGVRIPPDEISFTFVRSSGPGGQNVNKVNTKAVMRWALAQSKLPEGVLERFREKYRARITREGDVVVSSQRYREQARNREDCVTKLVRLLQGVAEPPKPRRASRPSAASRRRRRRNKQFQAQKKKLRKSPSRED